MDADLLTPAPDLDAFDPTQVDRGDNLPAAKAADPEPEDPPAPEDKSEAEDEPEDKSEADEPARDENGRFKAKAEAKIPKARFDEAVGKERDAREAAERRAADLERQLAEKQERQAEAAQSAEVEALEAKIGELEKQHAQFLLDGEIDKAAKAMGEIRRAERQIAKAEITQETVRTTSATLEAERVELAIAQMESEFPQLNPKSETFDEDLVHLALAKQRQLIQSSGLSPSKALIQAATAVMARFGVKAEPEAKDEKGLAAAKAQADRKESQVKKNLDTIARQPASTKDVGLDSDKLGKGGLPDVSKLTSEEFAALPESTIRRLRGDSL